MAAAQPHLVTNGEPNEADPPIGELLGSIAQELELARTIGLRVERAICAIAIQSTIDSALVAELQNFDAVLQHIAAMRHFSGELGRSCDASWRTSPRAALERVTLAEVKARLGGEDTESTDELWEIL